VGLSVTITGSGHEWVTKCTRRIIWRLAHRVRVLGPPPPNVRFEPVAHGGASIERAVANVSSAGVPWRFHCPHREGACTDIRAACSWCAL
jgi:hypothetical protein